MGRRVFSFLRTARACHRSYWDCISIHISAELFNTLDRLKAFYAEMPALPFNNRDKVTRLTPRFAENSVTSVSPMACRTDSPGCGGLCMSVGYVLSMNRHAHPCLVISTGAAALSARSGKTCCPLSVSMRDRQTSGFSAPATDSAASGRNGNSLEQGRTSTHLRRALTLPGRRTSLHRRCPGSDGRVAGCRGRFCRSFGVARGCRAARGRRGRWPSESAGRSPV